MAPRNASPAPTKPVAGSSDNGGPQKKNDAAATYGKVRAVEDAYAKVRAVQNDGPSPALSSGSGLCLSLAGFFLFFLSLYALAMNEHSTVCTQRAYSEALIHHHEADCDGKNNAPKFLKDGDVVHYSCPISKGSLLTLTPADFSGVADLAKAFKVTAAKVRKDVKMWQCAEAKSTQREKRGDTTVDVEYFTYTLGWHDIAIDSSQFYAYSEEEAKAALMAGCGQDFKRNFEWPSSLVDEEKSAKTLVAGVYDVSRHLDSLGFSTPVAIAPPSSSWWGKAIYKLPHGDRSIALASVTEAGAVQSCPIDKPPSIGCMRVAFTQSSAKSVSALTRLTQSPIGNKLYSGMAWRAETSWMCRSRGPSNKVDLFMEGDLSAEEMVAHQDTSPGWAIRIICVFLSVLSIAFFLLPIKDAHKTAQSSFSAFYAVPLLGPLLSFFRDFLDGALPEVVPLTALRIGLTASLTVMLLAWAVIRPLLGLASAIVCVIFLVYSMSKMSQTAAQNRAARKTAEEAKKDT